MLPHFITELPRTLWSAKWQVFCLQCLCPALATTRNNIFIWRHNLSTIFLISHGKVSHLKETVMIVSRFPILNPRYSILDTRYSSLNSQSSILNRFEYRGSSPDGQLTFGWSWIQTYQFPERIGFHTCERTASLPDRSNKRLPASGLYTQCKNMQTVSLHKEIPYEIGISFGVLILKTAQSSFHGKQYIGDFSQF